MADVRDDAAEVNEAEQDFDLSKPDVVTKYNLAGEIANKTLAKVVQGLTAGAKIADVCAMGDAFILEQCAAVYKSAKVEKGIGFPVCISVNNCCANYSPLQEESSNLNDGDVCKVDLGVHIDGYMALVATTHVIGAAGPITGRQADAIAAANAAAEVAFRLIKPGNKNNDVTRMVERTVAQFKCEPVEGVQSHQLKRFTIDGPNTIINKSIPGKTIPECTFAENEIYVIDIVVSTGEGKAREQGQRVTVFKRAVDNSYALKLKAARQLFHEIKEKHPHMPFSLREFGDQRSKMGVTECVKHDLVQPYPVYFERDGEFVAQIKFTVLLLPAGPLRITSHPLQELNADNSVQDEEITALLAQSMARRKKKKKPAAAAPPS